MEMIKKTNILTAGVLLVTSFILLMICSRSSFLYPCNDWNDANSYFTMGKAFINGQVLYRDVYDQKGPYLYLLYGIAYMFSNSNFYGVFLLEILAIAVLLFFFYKIMNLFCERRISLLLVPVMGAMMLSSKSFYWGGAAEEFCLPLLGYSLYASVRYFHIQKDLTPDIKMIFWNGLLAGIVMQIKYTMLGFYFAWMCMMLIAYMGKKDWRGLIKSCLVFLGAMFVTMIPWLVYFGFNHSLGDWYQCYIYNNVFLYSDLADIQNGLVNRIYQLAKLLLWLIIDNLSYFIFICLGLFYFFLSLKIRWMEKLNVITMISFLFLGIYFGGANLPYYAIPFMVFCVLGFIPIGGMIQRIYYICMKGTRYRGLFVWPIIFIVLLLTSGSFAYHNSMNTYFMKQDQDDYFLFQFEKIVNKKNNPTLVTIGCLDAGLFTVADIIPNCRFFQTNGIDFNEMYLEQERYIKEGVTDFVLTRDIVPDEIDKEYTLAAQSPYEWDGRQFTYYLFRKK